MLKIISYIFLLFILISCGQPSELSSEDFGYKLEAGQVTYFGDPYSGYVKEKFTPDDWFEGEYKNGVRHGKIIHYHDFYNYEEKTTLRIKKSKTTYENGIRNGEYRGYNFNGEVVSKGNYKNDKKHGDWIVNNQKYTYYEGKKHGIFTEEEDKLKLIGHYVKGKRDGDWFILNENRDTITKYGSYKKGKKYGLFKEYKPNYDEKLNKNKDKLYLKHLRFYQNGLENEAFRVDIKWKIKPLYHKIKELSYAKEKEDGLIEYGRFKSRSLINIITIDTTDQNRAKCQHLICESGITYSINHELETNQPGVIRLIDLVNYGKLGNHFLKNINSISGVHNSSVEIIERDTRDSIDESKNEILSFVKEEFGLDEILILKLDE